MGCQQLIQICAGITTVQTSHLLSQLFGLRKLVVKTTPGKSMGIPGKQLWGKAGWDATTVLEVFLPPALIFPQPHHSPSSQPHYVRQREYTWATRFSGCAGNGAALQQQWALCRHQFCGDVYSCKSIFKKVNMIFVPTGVKCIELSWKIATIFNYQIEIWVQEAQLMVVHVAVILSSLWSQRSFATAQQARAPLCVYTGPQTFHKWLQSNPNKYI